MLEKRAAPSLPDGARPVRRGDSVDRNSHGMEHAAQRSPHCRRVSAASTPAGGDTTLPHAASRSSETGGLNRAAARRSTVSPRKHYLLLTDRIRSSADCAVSGRALLSPWWRASRPTDVRHAAASRRAPLASRAPTFSS